MPATTSPSQPRGIVFEGHAIVSADGMIADGSGTMPPALRNEADYALFQAALDRAALVVVGRSAHERHPNAGRKRLVLTRSVVALSPDPGDAQAHFWNPATKSLPDVLLTLGIASGTIAITGVFDFFIGHFDRFSLAEGHKIVIPGGTPCFAAGHPRAVLAAAGMAPDRFAMIDEAASVSLTEWRRENVQE